MSEMKNNNAKKSSSDLMASAYKEKDVYHKSQKKEGRDKEGLPEFQKPVSQTTSGSQVDEGAIRTMRMLINFFVVYPLLLILIISFSVMAVKIIPWIIEFLRKIFLASLI